MQAKNKSHDHAPNEHFISQTCLYLNPEKYSKLEVD